jgi:hypothetical protein
MPTTIAPVSIIKVSIANILNIVEKCWGKINISLAFTGENKMIVITNEYFDDIIIAMPVMQSNTVSSVEEKLQNTITIKN